MTIATVFASPLLARSMPQANKTYLATFLMPIPGLMREMRGVARKEESMQLRSAAPLEGADDAGARWPGVRMTHSILVGRSARAGVDALALALALLIATVLRHDGDLAEVSLSGVVVLAATGAVVHTLVGLRLGLYTGRWAYGCFEEIAALAKTAAVTTPVLFVLDTLFGRLVPRSAIIASGLIALVLAAGARYSVRLTRDQRLRPS